MYKSNADENTNVYETFVVMEKNTMCVIGNTNNFPRI